MELYEGIIKAGWAKDGDDALSLLLRCLVSVNHLPMELEDFDNKLTPGDVLTLYQPNPSGFNAFAVAKEKEWRYDEFI